MDSDTGRRNSTIRRSEPVNKVSSTPPRSRAFPFGVDYKYDERPVDVREDIYRTPQIRSPSGTHITTIPLRTPEPPDPLNLAPIDQLTVTTAPFGNRNTSMRSPIRDRTRTEKAQASASTLRRESDVVRRAARAPRGEVTWADTATGGGEPSWPGSKLGGQVMDGGRATSIRSYWQQNIQNENRDRLEASRHVRPKSYGFPKWRSSDALSASLVASNPVEIPRDSRIPEQRLMKMEQTDKEAVETRQQIQQSIEPPRRLHKGKSLDSLVMQNNESQPWYDREKIREGISRESIANIGVARQRFESGDFSSQRRERCFSSCSSRATDALPPPPPLPPKSEEVQMRQMAHRDTHQDYSIDSYQSSPNYAPSYKQNGHAQSYTNGSIPSGPPSLRDHPTSSAYNYEQQLLILYLKQNPDIATTNYGRRVRFDHSLGLSLSESARQMTDEMPWRRVELRCSEDETSQSYQPQSFSPGQRSAGRYLKKTQVPSSNPPPRFRRNEPPREARRGSQGDPDRLPGESLIAAEIRSAREREEELRRSRSELGLPTLEDTMDLWRSGQRGLPPMNPLRGALSYDHLHQQAQQNMPSNLQKTASISELSHDNYASQYRREENGSCGELRAPRVGYGATPFKLQHTEDQDVMMFGPSSARRQQAPPTLKRFE